MSASTRRQLLGGMAVAAAVGAVPAMALAKGVDRSAWNKVVAEFERAEAHCLQLGDACDAASDAGAIACPDRPEFFSHYGMGCGWTRERNFEAARWAVIREHKARLGRPLVYGEGLAVAEEANRVVDDFDAWQAAHREAYREYDRLEPLFDKAVDERNSARQALFTTPAPDEAALLFKIERLTAFLDATPA